MKDRLLRFISPQGKINRKEFLLVFISAIVFVVVLEEIAFFLWYQQNVLPNNKFNLLMTFLFIDTEASFIFGFMPLIALNLVECTRSSVTYDNTPLLFICVFAGLMYVVYLFQCMKRCRDIGVNVLWSFLPIFNPFILLMQRSKNTNKERNEEKEDDIIIGKDETIIINDSVAPSEIYIGIFS